MDQEKCSERVFSMKKTIESRQVSLRYRLGLMILLGVLLSACGSSFGASPTPIPLPAVGGSTDSGNADSGNTDSGSAESSSTDDADATAVPADSVASDAAASETVSDTISDTVAADGVPAWAPTATPEAEAASAETASTESSSEADDVAASGTGSDPVQLDIERIRLSVPITPMEWRIVRINDQRTTDWIIPEASAGWHPDSASSGQQGNLVISGYQNAGDAVFAQLALGNVQVGMEILLTAADGTVHTYVVSEVGTPIPLDGAGAAETEQVVAYYAPSDEAKLTLVTGWPAFTTTHRLFVVATLVE